MPTPLTSDQSQRW